MRQDDPRDWPQRVVAIDPGAPHHGVVMAAVKPDSCLLLGAWEFKGEDELFDRYSYWARGGGLANLILEEYRLYPWQARNQGFSDFPVPQAIGVLKYISSQYQIPVTMQKAAIKKEARKIAQARGLPMAVRSLGSGKGAYRGPDFDAKWFKDMFGVRSSQHIRDAMAHLVHWVWTNREAPAPRITGASHAPPTPEQVAQGWVLLLSDRHGPRAQAEGEKVVITNHGKISVVVGGQFGSEGKGAVAGWLARPEANEGREVLGVRVGGPNAGHTVYGECPYREVAEAPYARCKDCNEFGHPWALRQVPVAAVTNPEAGLIIAAGSEVDPAVLYDEILWLDKAGYAVSSRLVVDTSATLLLESHRVAERGRQLTARLGSTGKGIGAARVDRLWREAATVGDGGEITPELYGSPEVAADTRDLMERCLAEGGHVIIEGTQGYGLGLHTEYYPYCTSGDCRAIDFLAQAGLNPWIRPSGLWDLPPELRVVVCFRPYPIRVAGNSGPMGGEETSWEALGLPTEYTTVTKKPRRVAEWDPGIVEAAIRANGGLGPHLVLALTMLDHVFPEVAGWDKWHSDGELDNRIYHWIQGLGLRPATAQALCSGISKGQTLLGTGPTTMLGEL